MTIPPSFSYENATSLYTREAFLELSPHNLVLYLLIVGAIHNVFKENLRLAKQSPVDRQFAKQIWTHGPYRFDCYLNIQL